MRFAGVVIVLLFCSLESLWALPQIVMEDGKAEYRLGKELEYLEDKVGDLTIKDVRSETLQKRWKPSKWDVPNFGFSKSVYWVRFSQKNSSMRLSRWFLELAYPHLDDISLYIIKADDTYERRVTGDILPFDNREIDYHNFIFTIDLEKGNEQQIYIRVKSESTIMFPLTLWQDTKFMENINKESMGLYLYYGILFIMFFYNSFLYVMVRDINHLYYIFYLFTWSLFQLTVNGIGFQFFWSDWTWFNRIALPFNISVVNIGVFTFSAVFLQTKKYAPYLHKSILFLIAWGAVNILLSTIAPYSVIIKPVLFLSVFAVPILIWAAIFCLNKGYRPARFYLLAFTALLVGIVARILITIGIPIPQFISIFGVQIGSAIEMTLLSLAIGDKINLEQEEAKAKIKELNVGLERKVDEKTRDIKSILTNIKQGIFTIYDPINHFISKEYSQYLENIIESEHLHTKKIREILLENSDINEDKKSQIESILTASLGENIISFRVNQCTLPRELKFRNANGEEKCLETEWAPIVGSDDIIEKILVCVRDVTENKKLEKETKKHRREMIIIDEILSVNPDFFQRFIASSRRFIAHNRDLISKNREFDFEVVKVLFINMHTIKGSARSYGFKEIAGLLHAVEQSYASLQRGEVNWGQGKLLKDLEVIESVIDEYDSINRENLGRESVADEVKLKLSTVKKVLDFVSYFGPKGINAPYYKDISRELHDLYYEDLHSIIVEMMSSLPSLAKDLKKEIPSYKLTGEKIGIDQEGAEVVRNILIHILRNSMDHGIESGEDREKLGKPREGSLSIDLKNDSGWLVVNYKDDGRGLNLEKIKSIGIEKGILEVDELKSSLDIANMIMESGFSTASDITHISGRGVGMSAVKSYIEEIGGHVSVCLEYQQKDKKMYPFTIRISIPEKHLFWQSRKSDRIEDSIA